jgi:internalin A
VSTAQSINLIGKVQPIGRVVFLRAELADATDPQFAILRYGVDDVEQPLGLRIDLNKRALLDFTEERFVDEAIAHVVGSIIDIVQDVTAADAKDPKRNLAEARNRIRSTLRTGSATLSLAGLGLTSLPAEICSLNALQRLDLHDNHLTALPPEIGALTALKELFVYNNQLAALPPEIGSLTALQELNLHDNQLATLPSEIDSLTALQSLDLRCNQLATLPQEIGSLTALQTLRLSDNSLATLSPAIGSLTALQRLGLSRNLLTSVPANVGMLTALRRLDINDNQLVTLPPEIGSLTALQLLDLSANQLTTLSPEIRLLTALTQLFLHHNPGLGLPDEVLGPTYAAVAHGTEKPASPVAILDYYFRVSTQPTTPLNEGKMILVGRGEVGKTSLVRRLRENKFDEWQAKTDGIRIEPWPISPGPDGPVLLHVWDFGGQEIMHATHRFFLTRRSLYLVVLNGREGGEDADAEYWLKTINALAPDSPVLVVLNKYRSHPASLNRTGLCAKYPNVCGFVQTDCAGPEPLGIDKLEQAIKQAVNEHLPDVRAKFPASWSRIKDALSQMRKVLKKDFITFDQYRDLCDRHNETDPIAQENLAGFLNDLGIALNYDDDPRLADKHVLNPQWVTEGIYKILNAPALAEAGGALHIGQLSTILSGSEYPKSMHGFVFELMRKFELCFPFPDRDGAYLIPELLSKDEHADARTFRGDAGATRFHYRYEILPEGLIPRFIVRTYVHSEGMPRWRTGVVLRFEGNTALVWADMSEGRVEVIVTGNAASRRRLLAVVRSQFDHIHDHLKLRPREEVSVPSVPGLVLGYGDLLTYEREGERQPRIPFGGALHKIDVMQVLYGLDVEGARSAMRTREPKAVRLFYSYSSKDEQFKTELETHLSLLKREGKLATWHMKRIVPGTEWDKTIDENLKSADIILLMISSDFLASDYIWDVEVKQAMAQHESGKSHVIPVFVRDCSWTSAPFGKLQGVPKGKAVKLSPDRDTAWREVSDWIRKIVDERAKASS